MRTKFYLIFTLFLFFNCIGKKEEIHRADDFLSQFSFDKGVTQQVFLIPSVGCSGCITKAEKLAKSYANIVGYQIIITNYTSIKDIRYKLGTEFLESSNVILDSLNLSKEFDFESIYPQEFILEEGLVRSVHELGLDQGS